MLEFLVGLLGAARQFTPALLLGVTLTSGAMLFLPSGVLEQLGLAGLAAEHRPYIGAALLVALSLLVAQSVVGAWAFVKGLNTKRKSKQAAAAADNRRRSMLSNLTPEEKSYLAPYIFDAQNTQYFPIEDGVAGGLAAKHIIFRASNVSSRWTTFAFNMQPWAREHLNENPHLLN